MRAGRVSRPNLAGRDQTKTSVPGQTGIQILLLTPTQAADHLKQGDVDGVLVIRCVTTSTTSCAPAFTLALEGSNPATARQFRNVVTLLLTGF